MSEGIYESVVGGTAASGATRGAGEVLQSAQPGWWTSASDYVSGVVEDTEDWLLNEYSHSSVSDAADAAVPKVQAVSDAVVEQARAASDAAKKYAGYFGDPANVQNTLDTVKWVLIAAGVLYVLVEFGPIARRALS